jgi:hypothetical protein
MPDRFHIRFIPLAERRLAWPWKPALKHLLMTYRIMIRSLFLLLIVKRNKRASYSLTRTGRKQLEEELENWGSMSAVINRLLKTS